MKSNKTAIGLLVIGLIFSAMSMKAVFFSGSEVENFYLDGRSNQTAPVHLEPEMNPLRLLIEMDVGTKAFSNVQRYVEYFITAKRETGETLWVEDGRVSVSSDKKNVMNQTHYSSVQTFDIDEAMDVQFIYQIKEANLRYKGGSMTLKRNVSRHNWIITIIGVVLLVSGVLMLVNNKKKA